MKPIYMSGPWITEAELRAVSNALVDCSYAHPYEHVERFEREFASWHGRRYALMTTNCSSAIHLVLKALGVGPGDEVIVPECTWIASAAPLTHLGAVPVFCDIDPLHWCIDVESARKALTPRTKGIIAVDLHGSMPDMAALTALAHEHALFLLEDAAQGLGSTYRGKPAGSFGTASVFSFGRTKTLTTGEGGMLLLDDAALFERCSTLRDHGRRPGGPTYYNYEVGFKFVPSNMQAALGLAQLGRIGELIERKRRIFDGYKARLAHVPDLLFNTEPDGGFNSAWVTGVVFGRSHGMTKHRAIEALEALGIPSRPFFYPLSSLPAYPGMEEIYRPRNPIAYDISERAINLPCAMNLEDEQLDAIAAAVCRILGHRASAIPPGR